MARHWSYPWKIVATPTNNTSPHLINYLSSDKTFVVIKKQPTFFAKEKTCRQKISKGARNGVNDYRVVRLTNAFSFL